jgi:hypothetical protein
MISTCGGKFVKAPAAYDHWHREQHDVGRPKDGNVTLGTLQRAAELLGRKVRLELI